MPRIRSIKPDFFKSEDVAALPLRARLLWIGLWTQCDDHGRYKDAARVIKGDVWSLDDVSLRDIEEDLAALAAASRIVRYEVDSKRYLAIVNWHVHQAINRPSRPRYPGPPEPTASADRDDPNHCDVCAKPGHGRITDASVNPHGALTPGREGKGKEREGSRAEPSVSPPGPTDPGPEPPPRCPQHLDQPTTDPCGPCGTARRARDAWERANAAAASARQSAVAHDRAAANQAAIAACPLCDEHGYLGGVLCAHDPAAGDRTRRGVAAARAALNRTPNGGQP